MKNINDLSVYLKSFISKTIELTGSDSGYFSILNDENEILIIEHNNIENINIFNFRLLLGEGIEGWVLRKNVPLLIPNLKIDPRFHAAGYRLRSDIRSCICLPVESDSIKGTLTLFKNKDEFSNTDTKLIFKYIQNYKQSFEKAWNLARFEYLLDFTGTFNKITNKALDFNNQRQFIEYVKNKFKDLFHTDYFNICFKGEKFFDECSNDFKKCPAFINKIFQISAETNYCSQSKHNKDNILLCIPVKRSSMDFNGILSFQMPMNLYYRIKPFLNLKDIQDSLSLAFAKYSLESEIISSKGSVREENNFISCSLNILERTNYEGINSLCSEAVNCLTELFSPDGATLIVNEPNNSPIIIRRGLDEKIDHAFSKKIYETLSEIPDRILDIKSDKLNEKLRKKGITRFICAKLNDTKKQLGYIGFSFSKDPGDFNYKLFENASKILFYAIESSIKSRNNNNYIKELTNEIFKLRSEEKQLKFSSKQTENISQKLKSTRNKAEQSQNTLNLINQLYQISLNSKDISDTYKSILPAVIKHLKSNLATATIGMIDPSREKYKIVDSLGIKHSRINDFEKKLLEFPKILSKTLTKEKKPLFCNDLSEFPQIQKFLLTKKLGSFYAWPIIINGKTTGTFTIASKNIKGILNEDIELINSVIPQISLISENTMNLKRNQNLINVYSALHRASVAITADKDYKLWLDQVLKNAASIYDYQFFAIILNEKRSFKTIGLYGISENNYNLWKKDHLDSVIAETINNCNNIVHPVNFSNVPLKDEPYVHSWMSMPLNTGNTTFGAIITGNFYPRIYNNEEIEIFNLLSEKITQGLFNFSLYNNVLMEKSRIETIIESQGEGLIIINLERKITHFNKAAELITSYSSSDVIGKDCSHIFKGREIDGDLRCETNCPLIELMNDPDNVKDKYFSESLIIDKKGEEKILSCVHSILKFNSEIFGVLIVFRDITSEKLNQQIKTDFIAGISHDLRTPLSAIKGYASTLLTNEEEFDECTRREFLEVISGEVDHLTRLLDNLMDITKIEAGAIKPYIEEMILAPVLEKAVKTHQFSTKKHKIILNLIDTDTIVLADMYMLQRILNNLINNAIKYSPEGGSIIISAEKKEDMCLISIKDEGLGISEEDQKHIFERFKRSSSKKKNRVWGSGVGLFIVKTLISSINGNIRVESQLGKGTTFFLTLPLYKNEGEIK